MSAPRRPADPSGLERYYVLTRGRSGPGDSAAGLDVATLVVSRSGPVPGLQHEHQEIVRRCREPLSVAELGAHLGLPFNILAVLLSDLLEANLALGQMHDVAHQGFASGMASSWTQRRIVVVNRTLGAQVRLEIDQHPPGWATGRAIVAPLPEAIQQR